MPERVLVTGAGGFVGSHVVRRLLVDGHQVVALVRPQSDRSRLEDVAQDVELVELDLAAGRAVDLGPLRGVLHLAARGVADGASTESILRTNVLGTQVALELAARGGAAAFLYCGSCFEYGPGRRHREDADVRPISAYGASKTAGWLLARAFGHEQGMHVVGVRPFTVYGPHEGRSRLVPSVCLATLAGEPLDLTGGEQTRDFVYAEDAAEAIVRAAWATEELVFNICSGTDVSVREVAELIVGMGDGTAELRFGARDARPIEYQTLSGDPALAAQALGWTATTALADGLRRTLDWWEERVGVSVR